MFFWDNKITDLTCQKSKYHADTDILRIHAFWQFYRYKTNITAFFEIRKYRLVGDIAGFRKVIIVVICSDKKQGSIGY